MRRTRKKKQSQVIPILFTLGIIGWGFFAIDRLTGQKNQDKTGQIKFSNLKKAKNQDSWLKNIKEWIAEQMDKLEEKKTVKDEKSSDQSTVVSKTYQPNTDLKQKIYSSNENINSKSVDLYFYKSSSSRFDLKKVKRKVGNISSQDLSHSAIHALIKGPTAKEKLQEDLLDSFPAKPKLLQVKRENDALILNFGESFAQNISHQMIKHQLKQLLKTAKQFKGVNKIQIRIKNQIVSQLGNDGIMIPAYIQEGSWPMAYSY